MGTLYLVATPIGNLEDITARALRLLGQVRLIAAEDTRQTRKLLDHYGLHTPLTSYHEHNKLNKLDAIMEALAAGDVALVSDAGTPALNDPGYELVRAVLEHGYDVSPVPGPNAPLAALVASGLPTDSFLYLGYLSRKASDRSRQLEEISSLPYTLIFLETPHRLLEAFNDLKSILGDRPVAVARELTKLHEEIFRGSLSQAQAHFITQSPRGEFTLVIAGHSAETERWPENQLQAAIHQLLANGMTPTRVASQLARQSGWPRKTIYQMVTRLIHEENANAESQ